MVSRVAFSAICRHMSYVICVKTIAHLMVFLVVQASLSIVKRTSKAIVYLVVYSSLCVQSTH